MPDHGQQASPKHRRRTGKIASQPDLYFLFRLARDLGKTVGELMEISHAEFLHWIAFYEVENSRRSGKTIPGVAAYSLQGMTAEDQTKLLDRMLLGK